MNNIQINVVGLTFTPMSGHAQQYLRSFESNVDQTASDNLNAVHHRMIQTAHEQGAYGYSERAPSIDPEATVPFLHNIVRPEIKGVPVELNAGGDGSWETEVASFVLVLDVAMPMAVSTSRMYVAGYTDRPVPRDGTPIDPNTRLNVNSIFEYRELAEMSISGLTTQWHLMSAVQVLADRRYAGLGTHEHLWRARPVDTIATMARLSDPMIMGSGITVVDVRTMLSNASTFAGYAHNDPTLWIEAMLEANAGVTLMAEENLLHTNGPMDRFHQMQRIASTVETRHNPLLRAVASIEGAVMSSSFNLGTLAIIDQQALGKISVVDRPERNREAFDTSLEGCDVATSAANYLLNSVPALMAKYGIASVDFHARNLEFPVKIIINSFAMVHGNGEPGTLTAFVKELRLRVMNAITFDGAQSLVVTGDFNLFGTSLMVMDLDSQGERHYASPTFANALFSPQVTTSMEKVDALAENFMSAFEHFKHSPISKKEIDSMSISTLNDAHLTGEQLDDKYNPDGDGQHPTITRAIWRAAVESEETITGYWDWVAHKLQEE